MSDWIIIPVLLLFIFGILSWGLHQDKIHPPVCLETTQVVSIDSISYRSAKVTMGNGQTYDLYQATLKPGDNFCLKWKEY